MLRAIPMLRATPMLRAEPAVTNEQFAQLLQQQAAMSAQLAALATSHNRRAPERAQDKDSSYETDMDMDMDTDDEFVQPARAHARIGKARFRPPG